MNPTCNICGKSINTCDHIPGREYNGLICTYPEASVSTAPMTDDEVSAWEYRVKNQYWGGLNVTMSRMLATIRDRDKKLEAYQASAEDLSKALDDTKRAEALILYNSFIARGWGDGDKAAFASRAEAAIEAAAVFNETWEKRND